MKKNDVIISEASGYGSECEAVFLHGDSPVFVPFCIRGERAEIKILSAKGGVAYGRCERVLSPSPARVDAPCPVFGKCGGCQLQHMRYEEQLALKADLVKNTLKKIGGIDADVLPVYSGKNSYRYRNKLVLPVGRDAAGGTKIGFFAPRSHRIVDISDCLIQSAWCADIIEIVKAYMRGNGLTGYDELSASGDIRRIAVRELDGKFIVVLVAAHAVDAAPLAGMLAERFGHVTLLLNINASRGNAVFGEEWRTVCGEGFFEAEDMGIRYRAGANTFLQVNDDVRSGLYARIAEEGAGAECAVDLYSGGGMLTALLARACGRAFGIEVVKEASICADELKELNGLGRSMQNICGKVEDELAALLRGTSGARRVIVCDPPRKGMERSAVEAVKRSGAEKIILVSCNPATLARDLGLLVGSLKDDGGVLKKDPDYASTSGYKINYILPFDMFPQTKHVETLVCLERK